MRIIAFMNQKGGVGKTTTTVNLGAALAAAGKRVCLIDLDPQAHLTINYGVEPSPDHVSLYDVLIEDRGFLEAVHKVSDNIALVPSSIDLAGAEVELVSMLGRELLLKKRIEAARHDFDFILMDCPPSLGLLTINALAVATEVIIPMQPHFLALQGVAKLLETVQLVNKRMNPGLKVSGIVLTMYDAQTKLSAEVVNELNGFIEEAKGKPLPWADARIFEAKIRRNIKLAESPSFGQTILDYDPTSNGAADYRALAAEVLAMQPGAAGATKKPVSRAVTVSVNASIDPTKLAAAQVPGTLAGVSGAGPSTRVMTPPVTSVSPRVVAAVTGPAPSIAPRPVAGPITPRATTPSRPVMAGASPVKPAAMPSVETAQG